MNISCALSNKQIEKLYKFVYKSMAASLKENKPFKPKATMIELFKDIESKKDADIAAKFIQLLPQMMFMAAGQTRLLKLNVNTDNLRKLAAVFSDEETGLLDVLNYFKSKSNTTTLKNSTKIAKQNINEPKDYSNDSSEGSMDIRLKPESAFTTTMQQFVAVNPNSKNPLTTEIIDPNRIRIYNTLEKIRISLSDKPTKISDVEYQNRVLKLKALPLIKIKEEDRDTTTNELIIKGASIAKYANGKNLMEDAIAVMVVDQSGIPILFNEQGDIQSRAEGGKPVYQFLRQAKLDSATGEYSVKDIYGQEEKIQTPEEILSNTVWRASKLTLDEYKAKLKKEGKDYEEILAAVKKQQQEEFKELAELNKIILKDGEKIFDLMDVSAGVPDFLQGTTIGFKRFLELSETLGTNYSFDTLKENINPFKAGSAIVTINGKDFFIDRKGMSEELINKLAEVLTNENIHPEVRFNYYEQFSNNKINEDRKKLLVGYDPKIKSLILQTKPGKEKGQRADIDLTDLAKAKEEIINALSTEYYISSTKKYGPANMKINTDLLNGVNSYFDYNIVTGEFQEANYMDFLIGVNPKILLKNENDEYEVANSYFSFRVNEKLNKELKEAKEQLQKTDFTEEGIKSEIRKRKDELVEKINNLSKNGNELTATVTNTRKTTFDIIADNKIYNVRFKKGVSDKNLIKDDILTFEVNDIKNVPYPVISVFDSNNKKLGQVSETDFKAGEEQRVAKTEKEVKQESDKAVEEFISPVNVSIPEQSSGISDLFNFDRKSSLPKGVTQEEIDSAKTWWEESPLSKLIKLEHMANIVNSDVYARFIIAGKRLEDTKIQLDTATGGSAVDLYHEAWHAFSQLYLTKEQKTKLYAETRKKLNNYDLSPIEVEEILAEDFRTYAKDPKPKTNEPIRNTLFRKIWNFIKALFGKRNTKDELFKELFFASKNPKLLNKYTPLVDNHMFNTLNRERGIFNADTKELVLNYQDSLLVSSQIDSALSQLIDEVYTDRVAKEKQGVLDKAGLPIRATKNGTIKLLTDNENKAQSYIVIKNRFENKLNIFKTQLEAVSKDDYATKTVLEDKIRILEAAINNWGDTKSGVTQFHIENSTFDLVKQKYIEIENEDVNEDDNTAPENAEESEIYADKEVGDKSLLQLAEKETLYILKSLFKVVDGKQVTGKLGFPELADFSKTWNIVTKVIGGEKSPEKMYSKLVEGANNFPELAQLVANKITNPEDITTLEEFNIKAAFWQDFKKTRLKYIQLTIDFNGEAYEAEVTDSSIEFVNIINKFNTEFQSAPKSRYIDKTSDNKSILNLDNVIEDFTKTPGFNSKESIAFARAIGIDLQDLSTIKNELDSRKQHYGLPSLFSVIKAIHEKRKDPKATSEQIRFINKFLTSPVKSLYGEIPEGIHPKTTSEKNIIQRLAFLQSEYGTNYSSFSVLNPERNLVNEFIEDNTISMIVDAVNNVEYGKDLWTKSDYAYMSYLNPNINSFTLKSQLLKNIFENDGVTLNKRKADNKLELLMVAGTQNVDEETGANTTSLDVQSKYIQELNTMLKGGIIEFMRHASKSSSFGMRSANGISGGLEKKKSKLYVDIDMFDSDGRAYDYATNNIFIDYIQAELERIQTFKSNKETFKKYKGYNRNVGTKDNPVYAGEVFTAFDNVLGDFTIMNGETPETLDLKQYLIDEVKDGDLKTYLKSHPEIKNEINKQIKDYFKSQASKNYSTFSQSEYIDPSLLNMLNVFKLNENEKVKRLVEVHTMNAWIHNFETASLMYGDIVQYNHAKQEMHKRNTGATSGGRGFMHDIYTQKFLNGDLIKNSSYAKALSKKLGKEYDTFNFSNTFNTAILQDVARDSVYTKDIEDALRADYKARGVKDDIIEYRIKKEMKTYMGMEEGDGQGFISFDAYRSLRLAEKNWSAEQESLFKDIVNNKPINASDIVRFFPVYKLQNFGHLADTALPVNAMHKFALMPLIPSVIKGSDLESLHHQMMKGNIQYVTFQTGSKVGSVTSQVDSDGNAVADQIYDDGSVEKTLKSDIKFTNNRIYLAYLKNVTEVPTKYKGKTVFSTQLRKLILEGLYEEGKILNKDLEPFIKEYETAIKDYTNLLKQELIEEIGYEKVNGRYVKGDITKFMDIVQNELERKDLPEHLVNYIQVSKDNKLTKDLSLHLMADDIEKILVSLVEKRIVKQKVKGEALVQVASSMSNGLWDSGFKFDKAQTADIKKYLGSNNLPFYHPNTIDFNNLYKDNSKEQLAETLKYKKEVLADQAKYYTDKNKDNLRAEISYLEDTIAGKKPKITSVSGNTTAMKVAIALQGDFKNLLKLNHNDKQPIGTRERLNEMIKNDEWLNKGNNRKAVTMTAVRIPVQGLNSMEFMEVYEFLDPSAGNIIIPPSEIVAKSGADFDVDKLTTFMPNIDQLGHYVETSINAKKLDALVTEAKKKNDKAEVKRLIKTQKANLENKLISSIRGILELPSNYATLVRPNDTYLLKDLADKLVEASPEYKEFKTISPTNVLEVGYNLHKHEANMVGKDVLGIIALENALNPLLTSLGAALPKTYKQQKWNSSKEAYEEVKNIDFEMRLLLDHNKTSDGRISLSHINSADKQDKIADLLSHLMNGSVDVEKDAWIFFIQANKEIIPTLLGLLKAGVPKEQAVKFVSQPLVKEYAKQQRLFGSALAKVTGLPIDNKTEVISKAKKAVLSQLPRFMTKDMLAKANTLKLMDTLKDESRPLTLRLTEDRSIKLNADAIIKSIDKGTININDITSIGTRKDQNNPDSDFINIYSSIKATSLLNNDNWYYTTKVYTADVDKFTVESLDENIKKGKDSFSDPQAIKAFLHFLEFEKQMRGMSDLKRQANPDTKTSKTIQEILEKTMSLEEAANSSKIDPVLAEKLQKESILGTFFDKQIIKDVVAPLFEITNKSIVSDLILNKLKVNKGNITKKFGAGVDGKHAFIGAYKKAIINYIYQNKLYEAITSEEGFPGIPSSFDNLNTQAFNRNVMDVLSTHTHLKDLYPILEQLTDVEIKHLTGKNKTKTLTLNNKNVVKGALAEAYHQNLIDLADDNVIKVKDPVENKNISDTFKILPLMSIYQNGVGNSKYGLSYVIPDTVYFELLEPASRNFLEKNLNEDTLNEIYNYLMDNDTNKNVFLKTKYKEEILAKSTINNEKSTIKEPTLKPSNIVNYDNDLPPLPGSEYDPGDYDNDLPTEGFNVSSWEFSNLGINERKVSQQPTQSSTNVNTEWYDKFWEYVNKGFYQQFIRDLEKTKSASEIETINKEIRNVYIQKLKADYPQLGTITLGADNSTLNVENKDVLKQLEPTISRLMVGNHGIYIEFTEPVNKGEFIKKRKQYNEYNRNGIKLYEQFDTVNYADYKPGKWYADINEYTLVQPTQQQGVAQTVKAYRTSDTFSSKVNYAQRGSGIYYGLDKPFQEMGANNKVEEVTVSYNPSKTLDATTEEGQTIFMQIKRSAIEGKSFPSMKESNNAVADAMRANGYESLIGWIDQDVKDAGRELVIYNQPTQQQAPVGETQEDDNTVTYKPTGKEKQTYTVVNNQIFNKNGDEVFKEASVDKNKILANLAVKQGRAVIVEHKNSKYIVNNRDIIISGTTGKVMQWPENNGDRKAIIALAKEKFAVESEEPQIDKNMKAFNAEVAKLGRMPKEFIVGESKWVLNNMYLYDLVDKKTGAIFLKDMNMLTGKIEEFETLILQKPVNQKQLFNFTKQVMNAVDNFKLDQILALKGINIEDIYEEISKVTTQNKLNEVINKILKSIC